MDVRVHVLNADPAIEPVEERLHVAATAAVTRLGLLLPDGAVDVVIQRHPFATIPVIGIGGFSPSGHLVHVSVDPAHEAFADVVGTHLSRTLAHELHHCARWRGPGYGRSLGEALVSEGLADHFDLEAHPGQEPYFWTQGLDAAALRDVWELARPELWEEGNDHAYWFFNSTRRGPPFHAGYALGFWLIGTYLATHPNRPASSLVMVPARETIEGVQAALQRRGRRRSVSVPEVAGAPQRSAPAVIKTDHHLLPVVDELVAPQSSQCLSHGRGRGLVPCEAAERAKVRATGS